MNDIRTLLDKLTALAAQHQTRAAIADALMAETETSQVRVPLDVMEQYLLVSGLYQALRSHAAAGSGTSNQAAALIMTILASGRMSDVDVHHPTFAAGMDELVMAAVVTATQRDHIVALGTRSGLVIQRYGVDRHYLIDLMANYNIGA